MEEVTRNKTIEGPGKARRQGITLIDLMELFRDKLTAIHWFEKTMLVDERSCVYCNILSTSRTPNVNPMP